ncbi:MAG: hypothetical protein ABI868_07355 [Acidobacteriota bacterium]
MTQPSATHSPDPDSGKGAVESDQPTDKQQGNPNGKGVDANGMPNDPLATAEDRIGANVDESQG